MDSGLEISDLHMISGFRKHIEKLRGDQLPPEDALDLECGEVESFDLNQHCGGMGLWVEQTVSEDTALSDFEKSPDLPEGFPLDRTTARSSDNSSLPKFSGKKASIAQDFFFFLHNLSISETYTDGEVPKCFLLKSSSWFVSVSNQSNSLLFLGRKCSDWSV